MSNICEHDYLRRKCPFCEIAQLERENEQLRAELDRLKRGGWVSVKERLPDPFEQVLVYVYAGISGRNSFRSIGSVTPIGKWVWDRNAVIFENARVTHWMPLPEPPEKGE